MLLSDSSISPPKMIFLSCLILIVGLMALDFINPSLPYIMKNLSTSQSVTKGLMVTYLITMSIAQFFYGAYSDNHGRRKAILLGFSIAMIGFIFSALSVNIFMLYLGRCITAMGMAATTVVARALIADVCHDEQSMKKAFGYFAMFSQVSPAIAPFFGGVIQHFSTWRISFLALTVISLCAFVFIYKKMPESHAIPEVKKLFRQQLVIYFDLMKMRQFMLLSLISSLVMMFTFAYYSFSPFIFHHMGVNAIGNGLMCIPYAVGLTSGAYFLSLILSRFDSERTLVITILSYLLWTVAMSLITIFYSNLWLIGVSAFVIGFHCGIAAALSLSLCMQGFSSNRGAASALQASMRYFFTAVGLFACNFIHLSNFFQLALIFLGIAIAMLSTYLLTNKANYYFNKNFIKELVMGDK